MKNAFVLLVVLLTFLTHISHAQSDDCLSRKLESFKPLLKNGFSLVANKRCTISKDGSCSLAMHLSGDSTYVAVALLCDFSDLEDENMDINLYVVNGKGNEKLDLSDTKPGSTAHLEFNAVVSRTVKIIARKVKGTQSSDVIIIVFAKPF